MVVLSVDVNYLAVFVSGIIVMVIGGFWYSPLLFGNIWMRLSGHATKDLDKAKSKGMTKAYVINFIAALVMVYVLAHFVVYANALTWIEGVQLGFWVWLGFIATSMIGLVLWDMKPFTLYVINSGYYLVVLMISGAILAAW